MRPSLVGPQDEYGAMLAPPTGSIAPTEAAPGLAESEAGWVAECGLFQLLTGALPLRAESMPELMHKIVHVPAPDVRALRPDLPEAVATLVAKALNKRPEDRYQTGAQLAQALTHAMDNALQQSIGEVTAAVVYDPDRSPAEQSMLLTKTTVLEHPQQQSPASRPVAAPVG